MAGAEVTLSDAHPDVARLLNLNQSLNPHVAPLRFLPIDWTRPGNMGPFEILIGSDILYEKTHAQELRGFIHAHRRTLKEIFISDPGRPYAPDLIPALKSLGFSADTRTVSIAQDAKEHSIRVMHFVASKDSSQRIY